MGPSEPYDYKLHSIGIDLEKSSSLGYFLSVGFFKFILFQFDPTLVYKLCTIMI